MRREPVSGRRGQAGALALVAVLVAGVMVVMGVAQHSGTTRRVYATALLGRIAEQLAESAVEEALASFHRFPPERLAAGAWTWEAAATRRILRESRSAVEISPVTLRALDSDGRRGQIEISCEAQASSAPGRKIQRRVVSRHTFHFDTDGKMLTMNSNPQLRLVDRSGAR